MLLQPGCLKNLKGIAPTQQDKKVDATTKKWSSKLIANKLLREKITFILKLIQSFSELFWFSKDCPKRPNTLKWYIRKLKKRVKNVMIHYIPLKEKSLSTFYQLGQTISQLLLIKKRKGANIIYPLAYLSELQNLL